MYHIIYKTTIISTGQFYIGKHSTKNPYDNYFGSSEYIKNYIKKYGLKDIRKEIIAHCDCSEQLRALESVYISKDINNELCLNKVKGMSLNKYKPYNLFSEQKYKDEFDYELTGNYIHSLSDCSDGIEISWCTIDEIKYYIERESNKKISCNEKLKLKLNDILGSPEIITDIEGVSDIKYHVLERIETKKNENFIDKNKNSLIEFYKEHNKELKEDILTLQKENLKLQDINSKLIDLLAEKEKKEVTKPTIVRTSLGRGLSRLLKD